MVHVLECVGILELMQKFINIQNLLIFIVPAL